MIDSRPSKRIRRNSPFAAFRDVPRLGSEYYSGPEALDPWTHDPTRGRFITADLPADHPAARHMGLAHNDALILGACADRHRFELTFSHAGASGLAAALATSGDWNDYCRLFPVTLRFERLSELRLLRLVEGGALQQIRACRRDLRRRFDDIGNLRTIAYDEGRIVCVLDLRCSLRGHGFVREPGADKRSWFSDYYLCVAAESLTVEERHREAWARLFGPERLWILERFEETGQTQFICADDYDVFLREIGAVVEPDPAAVRLP